MNQTTSPNYDIPYFGGLCEGFVEGTVGQATLPVQDSNGNWQTYGPFPSATSKWEAQLANHPGEQPPPGVRVPLYFALGSTPDGHTALQLEDGRVASSTQEGYHTTAYIHPNLEDLINMYGESNNGCTYLGWSEYIGKLKVIEGGDMPDIATQEDVNELTVGMSNLEVTANPNFINNVGRPLRDVITEVLNYPTSVDFRLKAGSYEADQKKIADLEAQLAAQPDPAPLPDPKPPTPPTPETGLLAWLKRFLGVK